MTNPAVSASARRKRNGILAAPLPGAGSRGADIGKRSCSGRALLCPRLTDSRRRSLDIEVLRDRAIDQTVELLIAEPVPPGGELGIA